MRKVELSNTYQLVVIAQQLAQHPDRNDRWERSKLIQIVVDRLVQLCKYFCLFQYLQKPQRFE